MQNGRALKKKTEGRGLNFKWPPSKIRFFTLCQTIKRKDQSIKQKEQQQVYDIL